MASKRPSDARNGDVSPPRSKRKLESTTTRALPDSFQSTMLTHVLEKSVANFFTPTSKKEPEKLIWRIVNSSLLVGHFKLSSSAADDPDPLPKRRKIAAFDFV